MKTVVIHAAKDLRIEDHAPRDCGPGEVRVRIERGSICGSDLHYYNHGGFGAVRLREPMILGHEVAGVITETGPGVAGLEAGQRVAVSPSRPCFDCAYCAQDLYNHCENMAFYGSAMPMPHVQGAFREDLVALAHQCHVIGAQVDPAMAAFAEPLSVALHAANRAGSLKDARVLVTGCGPIGALALLVARHHGAAEVVVTDILGPMLEMARRLGADRAIDVAANPDWTVDYASGKGTFDVMFEASGAGVAITSALPTLRPRARLVQMGLGGEVTLPLTAIAAKELEIRGTFRFHEEFAEAVRLINEGALDLAPLLTASYPVANAEAAFEAASDRGSGAMKVQIDFSA
jgi:L-idonate 5-dehydrogenase